MTPREIWHAFATIVVKELQRFTRIWVQTLLPPIITTSLYFVIFGALIGSRIGTMGGYEYMDYIVPGLIMMAVIQNSYSNVVSSFYSAKFQKHIEEILVSPTPVYAIVLGFMMGGMARGLLVGLVVTLVSLFFSDLELVHLGMILLVALFTAALFALGGLINGIFARSFDDVSIVPNFVLTPLIYLGGVFYSIELLPEFWRWVSHLNPILYMVNSFRYGFLGQSDIAVGTALTLIIAFTLGLFVAAMLLLRGGHGIRT